MRSVKPALYFILVGFLVILLIHEHNYSHRLATRIQRLEDALEERDSVVGLRGENEDVHAQHQRQDESKEKETAFVPKIRRKSKSNTADLGIIDPKHTGNEGHGPFYKGELPEDLKKESFERFAFNEYLSRSLSLNRTLPDPRNDQCKSRSYDIDKLPTASVIICFVDEAWSALMRSVWSVINRGTPELLEEVILVDDSSGVDWLAENLQAEMKLLPSFVKLIRTPERLGLIRARLFGAKAATGDVLIFLDSHIEANVGWLAPLLEPIHKKQKTAVTPIIDNIDKSTMNYYGHTSPNEAVGVFNWGMEFKWGVALNRSKDLSEPFNSPTMAGGLFAIGKSYFYESGSYDNEMDGWGGENIEMSFRLWLCGGGIVQAPCSHIGHIFRDTHPYKIPGGKSITDTFLRNSARLAEVWLDDYKQYFYFSRPEAKKYSTGDLSKRLALKQNLACKPFKYFLDNLMPNMFIPSTEQVVASGMLKNIGRPNMCVDKMNSKAGGAAGTYQCHGEGINQNWMLTVQKWIRSIDNLCVQPQSGQAPSLTMSMCSTKNRLQQWDYHSTEKTLKTSDGRCADLTDKAPGLIVTTCIPGSQSQKWIFEKKLGK